MKASTPSAVVTLHKIHAAMPCFVYLREDPNPIHCNEAPDEILHRVEEAAPDAFVHLATAPYAHDDAVRTGYVRARDVAAILGSPLGLGVTYR